MKQRFIRVGDELTDDVTVVVRGGDLDRFEWLATMTVGAFVRTA